MTGHAFAAASNPSNLVGGAGFKAGGLLWTMFFDVLKQNNLGRVLAEPNLVTTSGTEASFLAGGEYPIPVPQSGVGGGTTITIDYKKFGVMLSFTPTVLDEGKIAMKVSPEVSDLDFANAITTNGFIIPALATRRMSTHLEVKDGQTFAMAGLLKDEDRNVVSKVSAGGGCSHLGEFVPVFQLAEAADGAGGLGDPTYRQAPGPKCSPAAHRQVGGAQRRRDVSPGAGSGPAEAGRVASGHAAVPAAATGLRDAEDGLAAVTARQFNGAKARRPLPPERWV